MRRRNVTRRLQESIDERVAVRIHRSSRYAGPITGWVVRLGTHLVTVVESDDGGYQGSTTIVLREHIAKVEPDPGFSNRFGPTLPWWPPVPPSWLDLREIDDFRTLLEAYPVDRLVGIEREEMVRSGLWIGTIERVGKKWLWLDEIRGDASWNDGALGYRFNTITQVTFGGRYFDALAAVSALDGKPVRS